MNKIDIPTVVFLLSAIIFDRFARNKLEKKKRYIIVFIAVAAFAFVSTSKAIKDNPPVYANLKQDQIEFKSDEVILLTYIEELKYFEDTKIEVVANGYRWGNSKFYSGDANVRFFNDKDEEIDYAYRCKAYLNNSKRENDGKRDYILLKTKGPNKKYVLNFDTKKETKDFYEKLNKKFTELNE